MESAMTAILRDASGKMHHGILFDPPLGAIQVFTFIWSRDPQRRARGHGKQLDFNNNKFASTLVF